MREARQLGQYGVKVSEPVLDYSRLVARVREVVNEVCTQTIWRVLIGLLKLRAETGLNKEGVQSIAAA